MAHRDLSHLLRIEHHRYQFQLHWNELKLLLNSFCQGDVAVGGVAEEGKVWLVQFGQAFHQIHRSLTEVSGSKLRGVSAAVVGDKGRELKTGYPPDLLQVC